ncbi:hypothetical protein T02_1599, partial [Trichinella nativa]
MRLAYFVDIFKQLNKLNLQMQGKIQHNKKFVDSLKALLSSWIIGKGS